MAAKQFLLAVLCLAIACRSQAQTSCSFSDYNIPLPFEGCGQIGIRSLQGCPFCVNAYGQQTPLLSCGPAVNEMGDSIPCGQNATREGAPYGCTGGQICPVLPCPPICHTTCNKGCVGV